MCAESLMGAESNLRWIKPEYTNNQIIVNISSCVWRSSILGSIHSDGIQQKQCLINLSIYTYSILGTNWVFRKRYHLVDLAFIHIRSYDRFYFDIRYNSKIHKRVNFFGSLWPWKYNTTLCDKSDAMLLNVTLSCKCKQRKKKKTLRRLRRHSPAFKESETKMAGATKVIRATFFVLQMSCNKTKILPIQ